MIKALTPKLCDQKHHQSFCYNAHSQVTPIHPSPHEFISTWGLGGYQESDFSQRFTDHSISRDPKTHFEKHFTQVNPKSPSLSQVCYPWPEEGSIAKSEEWSLLCPSFLCCFHCSPLRSHSSSPSRSRVLLCRHMSSGKCTLCTPMWSGGLVLPWPGWICFFILTSEEQKALSSNEGKWSTLREAELFVEVPGNLS